MTLQKTDAIDKFESGNRMAQPWLWTQQPA